MASKPKAKPVKKAAVSKPAAKRAATKVAARKRPVRLVAKSAAGRKPLIEGQTTLGRSVRMAESYWAKVDKLGGVKFLRKLVDKARNADRLRPDEAY